MKTHSKFIRRHPLIAAVTTLVSAGVALAAVCSQCGGAGTGPFICNFCKGTGQTQ